MKQNEERDYKNKQMKKRDDGEEDSEEIQNQKDIYHCTRKEEDKYMNKKSSNKK